MTHTAGHVQKTNAGPSNPVLISFQLPSERRDRPKARENVRCCQNRVAQLLRCVSDSGPWTVASQAPLSMELSRQEYWSGLPFPSSGDLPNPGIKPMSLCLLYWQVDSLPLVPPGKPLYS